MGSGVLLFNRSRNRAGDAIYFMNYLSAGRDRIDGALIFGERMIRQKTGGNSRSRQRIGAGGSGNETASLDRSPTQEKFYDALGECTVGWPEE